MSFPAALPDDDTASASPAPANSPCGAVLAPPAEAVDTPEGLPTSPLVDPAALQDLGTQLDSPSVAKGFARDYARMWEQRYRSLASALGRRDQAESLEAVLSLKTSSAMVGGVQLTKLAGELEAAIRGGDMDRASSLLENVAESGSDTVDELQYSYILWDS